MDDSTLEGRWCTDSETGEEYLLDLKTGQVIMTRRDLNGK